jgi:hypothetical protein
VFDKDLLVCLEVKSHEDYKYFGICNQMNQVLDERKLFPYLSLSLAAAPSFLHVAAALALLSPLPNATPLCHDPNIFTLLCLFKFIDQIL